MLTPMSKERFIARMMYDAGYRVDHEERERQAQIDFNHYMSERKYHREHIFHRRDPKRGLGCGK